MILFVEREKGNDIQWMNKDISLTYSVFMFV